MSLIVLENVSLGFGAQRILWDLNVRIGEQERIGLIGPNGAGKSTLLRVMMSEQSIDSGQVRRANRCRIGYLPQDVQELAAESLLLSVLHTVPGRADVEARIAAAGDEMDAATDVTRQMELADQLAEFGEQLDHLDLYYSERQAIRILKGLGFQESDFDRPTAELSGGWKMRGALAGLLFQQPDVLFLDEPTNHLDLPSVMWLDKFLNELRSTMILICHDRDFLNRHIKRVLSFEPEGLRSYNGNYDSYLEQREAEEEVLSAHRRNRERELKRAETFVNRFKAKATKARQAQSRARRVKRLQTELEADRPLGRRKELNFQFPEVKRSGRDVVRLDGVSKAFGDLRLYNNLSKAIYAQDRVAIVGVNGAGKTTLLRLIAKELDADAGTIEYGSNVQLGYYAQHHNEQLTDERTVLDEIRSAGANTSESFIRGVCGAFLFSRDEVDKVVGVLSGGERARVLLAKLLVNPGNLLLMDEPTNHLDLASSEALAEALAGFGGTLVFVSHNTTFVNRLATRVWDIEGGELIDYPGTLDDYMATKARQAAPPATPPAQKPPKKKSKPKPSPGPDANVRSPAPAPANERSLKLKARIAALEVELAELETELADPALFADQKNFDAIYAQFKEHEEKIAELKGRLQHRESPPKKKPTPPPAPAAPVVTAQERSRRPRRRRKRRD